MHKNIKVLKDYSFYSVSDPSKEIKLIKDKVYKANTFFLVDLEFLYEQNIIVATKDSDSKGLENESNDENESDESDEKGILGKIKDKIKG